MKSLKTIAAFALSFAIASPALALTVGINTDANASTSAAGVTISAAIQGRITTGKERADQEITRRINTLTTLNTKVQAMVKLTGQEKSDIGSSIQTEITNLTELRSKIDVDADISTLKADIKSITASYRIFLLVIPQGHITVASDKLKSVADVEAAFATKLSARIDADAAAGKDVSTEKTALADMQAKISDANTQADAAATLVSTLTPDNGDKTKAAANAQALKDARAKIKVSLQDEVTARTDARTIVKGLAANTSASASASTTTP